MDTLERSTHLNASTTPVEDIAKIAYIGQPEHMKMYRAGYEQYFESLPVLTDGDEYLQEKINVTQQVMQHLSEQLQKDDWTLENEPAKGEFDRTIIAMEAPSPVVSYAGQTAWKEGKELVIARWGDGFTSPVHGHSDGYMHEEVLSGRIRVNTYRIVDLEHRIVRPVLTEIKEKGVFVSEYQMQKPDVTRVNLVHNFVSVGNAVSLHYLPEHTRDGRDNAYTVAHFPLNPFDVKRINSKDGMYLQKGDVVLVRSTNVPEYGDHYIVVTGPPVMKAHGFRVQDNAVIASETASHLLDTFPLRMGLTLLKLNDDAKEAFHQFHNIAIVDGTVVFPEV